MNTLISNYFNEQDTDYRMTQQQNDTAEKGGNTFAKEMKKDIVEARVFLTEACCE